MEIESEKSIWYKILVSKTKDKELFLTLWQRREAFCGVIKSLDGGVQFGRKWLEYLQH